MSHPVSSSSSLRSRSILLAGLFSLVATAVQADTLLNQNFNNGLGQFSGSGRVSVSGAVALRGGSRGGSITSQPIEASGYTGLNLQFDRQTSRLDSREAGRAEVSINGGRFLLLESSRDVSGNISLDLPAAADNASQIVLRFTVTADSYYETYTIDNIVLTGDRDSSQQPTPDPGPDPQPDPEPNPGNGQTHFWNLSGNLGAHDPTVMEENGVWYEFQTGPGIYRKVSYNGGFHWEPAPSVFPSGLWWWKYYVPGQEGTGIWAPDVKAYNGRVWVYYSISTFGSNTSVIGLASSPSLAADNWRDDGMVIRTQSSDDYNAIDPDLVIDANGDPWLTFGSWFSDIKLIRLNPSTLKPTGNLYSIARRSGGIEAPTIVHHNGYYYLFVSVGKCCEGTNSTYEIRYGRSRTITGPFLGKDGRDMLDGGNERWVGPGGQDISGTNVIARHAYDTTDNGAAKLLINTLNWSADNWPRY